MINSILGKKNSQTRHYTDAGMQIPVTKITAGPCVVIGIKTLSRDGYWAVQVGFGTGNPKTLTAPIAGILKKAGLGITAKPLFLRELPITVQKIEDVPYKVGDTITVDKVLQVGDRVKVMGITKGKGFQGGVKRHGFHGGPRTHGQSDRERAPGSIGQTTTPGRVYRGKRMAGRMGGTQVTISGLRVISLDQATNTLTVSGLLPGSKGTLLVVQKQNN
ncbi:MAG: 50S ribosomal protein L3 [Patescibacteria group bacterium]